MPGLPLALPFPFNDSVSSVSELVPGTWPAALDGRPLMIDDSRGPYAISGQWAQQGIQLLRQQADQSLRPAEVSLNPEGLWRRAQESWHRGAGQDFNDRTGSDEFRFRSSKGTNPWVPYELSLLNDTDQKKSGSSTNYKLAAAGSRLYLADGSTVVYTSDVTVDSPTWNSVTYAGGSVLDIATDGFNIYVTDGSNIYVSTTGSSTLTSTNTLDAGVLAWVHGRLMAAGTGATKHVLYNITIIGTPPAATFTAFNTDFTWVGFAEGPGFIYAAGYSGDKSLIYRTAVKADGTALDIPVVAGRLPDGEIIRSIGSYLGFILLGTDKGVRFCQQNDNSGNLTIGAYIPTAAAVRCFEGQDRFVWFGWSNYDSVSTGLGRLDVTQFTQDPVTGARVPAYSTDLMATGQGTVLSVVSFQNIRVFAVSAVGIFGETTTQVASGTIDSGLIHFGIPDQKTAIALDVSTEPLTGTITAALALDDGMFSTIGTTSTAGVVSTEYPIEGGTAEQLEVRITLTSTAVLQRWTLKATPGASDGPAEFLMVPFLLVRQMDGYGGKNLYCDPQIERDYIKALRQSRRVVSYQEDTSVWTVIVENFEWHPERLSQDDRTGSYQTPNGVMLTQLKVIT